MDELTLSSPQPGRDSVLRVIDLFAGCGGMSLGFHRAGYQIVGAVEHDTKAIRSHALNFYGMEDPGFVAHSLPRDITCFSPTDFARNILKTNKSTDQVDVIVGGPPCQAFARIGRAKLREIMRDPQAHLTDGRAHLFLYFLKYVDYFRPLAVVLENVPDMLNQGGKNVAEEIAGSLDDIGYECRYTILNAAHYGVPQYRQRVILLAFRRDLSISVTFPPPSTYAVLPDGYADARRSALGTVLDDVRQPLLPGEQRLRSHYQRPPEAATSLPSAVTAQEALNDLPVLYSRDISGGVKRFDMTVPYRSDVELSEYARQMRMWPGFEAGDGLRDHVTRYLTRDYRIFKLMQAGDEYPEAHAIAHQLFNSALERLIRQRGARLHGNNKEYHDLLKRLVPPYDPGKFPNKWCKMYPDQPARTLTAHLGKDSYTHIHYDSKQSRTITVREAARLQSFPDGFQFEGPMNAAFRQIGNAVPPMLAYALAEHIRQILLSRGDHIIGHADPDEPT